MKPPPNTDPLTIRWPEGRGGQLFRCHRRIHSASSFAPGPNAGSRPAGRFSFFGDPAVPAWYGAVSAPAAIAESIYHHEPRAGGVITQGHYLDRVVTRVWPRRRLTLALLDTDGLSRLGAIASERTDTPASQYRSTVIWAEALHGQHPRIDGLIWVSRMRAPDRAVVLFGDRVAESDLEIGPIHLEFTNTAGWDVLRAFGDRRGLDVEPPF